MDSFTIDTHRMHLIVDPSNPSDLTDAIALLTTVRDTPSDGPTVPLRNERYFSYDDLKRLSASQHNGDVPPSSLNMFGQLWGTIFRLSFRETLPMAFAYHCLACGSSFRRASEHNSAVCDGLYNPRRYMKIGGYSILENRAKFVALEQSYIKTALKAVYVTLCDALEGELITP